MGHSSYTKLFTGNMFEVKALQDALEHVGIEPVVKNEFDSGLRAGFAGGIAPGFVEVFVNETELEKATQILNELKTQFKKD